LVARTWASVKHEAARYWVGLKLLGHQVKVCKGILQQVLRGEDLTRREHRQLRTTSADLLKIIPFAIIVIVPFMELALPLILWLFPGILPSTFEEDWKKEEQMKRRLKARIEVARFLQDAVDQMAHEVKKTKEGGVGSADEFVIFMDNIHRGDARITNGDIVRFSQLFTDDITLDGIGRMGLVNLCRLLELPVFGTDAFLRFQLHQRMRSIRSDDCAIRAEGVDSLNIRELKEALHYRGMRATGLSKTRYKKDLESWLDLSLDKKVPTSLLLMSRALKITENVTEEDALKDTLQALPEEALRSAEAEAMHPDEVVQARKKLEALQLQQEMIEKEKKEKENFLVAEFRAASARFLVLHGAALVQRKLADVHQPVTSQAEAVTSQEQTVTSEADAVTSQAEAVMSREELEGRWEQLEAYLHRSLRAHLQDQQRFAKLDASAHTQILYAEIASHKAPILETLLDAAPLPAALGPSPASAPLLPSLAEQEEAEERKREEAAGEERRKKEKEEAQSARESGSETRRGRGSDSARGTGAASRRRLTSKSSLRLLPCSFCSATR